MLILLAAYQNCFKDKYLSDMKYDVKTTEMTSLLIISRKCMSKWFLNTIFIFVSPIIEQTKVYSKILELHVITFGTRR